MTRDERKDRLIKLEDLGVKSLADDFVIRLFSKWYGVGLIIMCLSDQLSPNAPP